MTMTFARNLRLQQMRVAASAVRLVCRSSVGQKVIRRLQTTPGARSVYAAALGFMRPFPTLSAANTAIRRYANSGHENPSNAMLHLQLSSSARPSDYAALFHIREHIGSIRSVFDLGGNVGNLFYCYTKYIESLLHTSWTVLDLPENMERGKEIADRRQANQLAFTSNWTDAAQADLLIVSGSMHYFERSLATMLQDLSRMPRFILINRVPMTDSAPAAAIQDARSFRVACILYNKDSFVAQLEQLGYRLVDRWDAAELQLHVAGYPEYGIPAYSGFFFTSGT